MIFSWPTPTKKILAMPLDSAIWTWRIRGVEYKGHVCEWQRYFQNQLSALSRVALVDKCLSIYTTSCRHYSQRCSGWSTPIRRKANPSYSTFGTRAPLCTVRGFFRKSSLEFMYSWRELTNGAMAMTFWNSYNFLDYVYQVCAKHGRPLTLSL